LVTHTFHSTGMASVAVENVGAPAEAADGSTAPAPALSLDDAELQCMGYKAELMRGFNGLMSFAFCFTAVAVLSSLSISFGTCVLSTGGPAILIWGWIVVGIFTQIVALAMGEICSTYPSAGSVYHWAGQLAPEAWAPAISFVTGWFNFLGNAAGDASFAFGFAQTVVSAQQLHNCPTDINCLFNRAAMHGIATTTTSSTTTTTDMSMSCAPPTSCHTYGVGVQVGIAIAIAACWSVMNVMRVDQQGWLNNLAAGWQIATTIAIVAVILSPQYNKHTLNDDYTVWRSWRNKSGFHADSYVVVVGLLTSLFGFSGYEAGAHMAEETRNASNSSPWGLIATTVMTALTGLLYILGLLYAIPRELGVFTSTSIYSNAASSIFSAATGNKMGLILTNILVVNLFFAGMSSLTVTSRIGFAMARDGAFPFSKHLSPVNGYTRTPMRSVLLVFVVDALLLLLPLTTMGMDPKYGPIAFNAVTSITVIGYQISYAIPIFLRVAVKPRQFVRGDFHLGPFSLVIGWIAAIWLTVTSIFLFFPFSAPVNKYNMNYTCLVVGGFMMLAGSHWWLGARHTFEGPKRVDAAVFKALAKQHAAGVPLDAQPGTP